MIQIVTPYDVNLVLVQKITFVLSKINKNCCQQSCTFWLQYAPNRLFAAEPTEMREGRGKWQERKGRGWERSREGRGDWERGSLSFAQEEKRKVGAYDFVGITWHNVCRRIGEYLSRYLNKIKSVDLKKVSVWSLAYSLFNRYHCSKHFPKRCPQDGAENQLT